MAVAAKFLRFAGRLALSVFMALAMARLSPAAAPTADEGLVRNERGAIVRGDVRSNRMAVLFAGLGNESLLDGLKRRGIHASFFVSADDLKSPVARQVAERTIADGHLLGPKYDARLEETIDALRQFGVAIEGGTIFALASDEASGETLTSKERDMGVDLVAPTPNVDFFAAVGNPTGASGVLTEQRLGEGDADQPVVARVDALFEKLASGGYAPVRVDQLCATAMKPIPRDPSYPPHWWTPVSAEGAPSWEILPQAAGAGEVMLSKRNDLGLLSNFAATPFTYNGKKYASVEGFWQMMKFPEGTDDPRSTAAGVKWTLTRDAVGQLTAFKANDAGDEGSRNMHTMGIDWVSFDGEHFPYRPAKPGRQYELIVGAMRAKLNENPEVKRVLLATGDLVLKPDHHQEDNAPAAWQYFQIWMDFRTELQQAK